MDAKPKPKLECKHTTRETESCSAAKLTQEDVEAIFSSLHKNIDAASQNAFLMNFITPYKPVRERKRKDDVNRKKRINAQYCIRKVDGSLVIVCAVAFRNIVQLDE